MTLETMQVSWEEIPEELGAFGVGGVEGDTKHTWDPKKPKEVEEAQKLFDLLKGNGYRAYFIKGRSTPGEPMTEFDPKAKRVLFMPAFQGG